MKIIKHLLLIALFTTVTSLQAQDNGYILSYISTYRQMALDEMQRTGVPACITLAQGILESQAGQSELAANANNHFGIKCKNNWTGNVVFADDDAKNECFRSYENAEASFKDHSDFLRTRPHYAFLFALDPADYKAWCYGLKKAGYATSSTYAIKLIRLIETYNISEITIQPSEKLPLEQKDIFVGNTALKEEAPHTVVITFEQPKTNNVQPEQTVIPVAVDYPDGVFKINHTKVIMATAGSSLLSLAAQYQVSYAQLLNYNDLEGNSDILLNDQLIFLERKPKAGTSEFYTVNAGETLYTIAQSEGVRLESLLEYNGLSPASSLQAKQAIRLQPAGKKSLFSKK